MSLINSGKQTIKIFQFVVNAMNKIESRSLASIFSLLFMFTATTSQAVKCVQAGYTAAEGAIICHPSYIYETRTWASCNWPADDMESLSSLLGKVTNPPFCGSATFDEGGIINPGEWGSVSARESQRSSVLEAYDIAYPEDHREDPICNWGGRGYVKLNKIERAICPAGFKIYDWFYKHEGGDGTYVCGDPPPAKECTVGNPIGIMHGTKIQQEEHIVADNYGQIPLSWHYVSKRQQKGINPDWPPASELEFLSVGRKGWKHNYDKRLYNNFNYQFAIRPTLELSRPDKMDSVFFVKISGNWIDAMDEVPHYIEEQTEEPIERWKYIDTSGNTEIYNPEGLLIKQIDKQGRERNLSYVNGELSQVINWKGNSLTFNYGSTGRVEQVADSAGHIYHYVFDGNLLSSVTFPDNTPEDLTDNPVRQYLYENSEIPGALTGIIDENGERYATWAYDSTGRAISSSHGDDVDTTTLSIGSSSTTVTNPLGKQTSYRYRTRNNLKQMYKTTRYATDNTPYTYSRYYYDTLGNLISRYNWRGYKTTYSYDSDGRQTSRTEASGTSSAKPVSTTWDTQFNKPLVVTEPNRITEYAYDTDGRLLSKSQRPNP
ncbi:MAG: hypothetical protein KME36_15495 [Candidatus Thiodiazotropha sp. (ex Lucina pensylvanica)]|nr:hypothetical protein [Candidatus Thiodiazotropha sp. (ex Lucina pensylvanica)]MBT3052331.1 hypothetical protein [Candidatus Thiodiazotropha sp. (ex Codakia orbicularis)]